jgi:polysaccharide biosynthesis protein PslE
MSPPGSGVEKYVPLAQEQRSRGPRDFLTILFKHRSKVGVIFLATVLAVTIVSFLLPPTYEAKLSLMVKFGREYVNRPEVGNAQSFLLFLTQEEVVNPEIQILSSRELIEKVLTTLKVETVYPDLVTSPPSKMTPLQAAVIAFGKNLTVEGVRKSNVIEVAFRHKDPRVAARAVNLLVDDYMEKHLQVFSDPQSSFLEKQLAEYETKLKESENRMEAFKRKNRVFSPEEQRTLLLKQYQEEKLLAQNTRKEIRRVRESLKGQETGDSTRADLRSLNARAATLARRLTTLENEIRTFDLLDNEFQALKREVASNEEKYRTYLVRVEEARISEEMNRKKMANISVIQPAEVPAKPITPKKGWNILLGMILGAVSGIGVAFFSEYTSESFSTPGIAEKQLALPVLTTIPHRD